jgi:hypothetical protein
MEFRSTGEPQWSRTAHIALIVGAEEQPAEFALSVELGGEC